MPTVAEQLIHYAKQHLGLTPAREAQALPGLCFGLANAAMLYASLGRATEFLRTLSSITQFPQQPTLAKRTLVEACLYLQSLELQAEILQQPRTQQSLSAAGLLSISRHQLQGHYCNTTASSLDWLFRRGAQLGLTGMIAKVPGQAHVVALLPTPDGWYLVDSEQAQSLPLTSETLTIWRRHMPINANISLLLATTMLMAINQILPQLQQPTNSPWWPTTPWKECFGRNAGGKTHTCTECGKTFAHSSDLTRHMRIHTGEKPFVCGKCGKGFTQKGNLTAHLRTHSGEKPYVCGKCGKGFTEKGSLTNHLRTHSGKKPFVCKKCGKEFTQSASLKTHLRDHSGERPYVCEICGKGFTRKGHLKNHLLTHSGEKPFVCEKCGRGFTQSSHLKAHLRIHSGEKPYVCEKCGKGFMTSSDLKTHMRIHTGEKPFVCEKCGKEFTTSSDLTAHLRTHSGEKLFVCGKCKRRFGHKQALNHHETICKSNHPGSPTDATNTAANLSPPLAPLSPARHQPGCPTQYAAAACSCQASVAAAAAEAAGESDLANVLTLLNPDEENTALDALQGLFETTPPPSLPPQSKCILCQDRPVEPSNTEGLCNTCSILYV